MQLRCHRSVKMTCVSRRTTGRRHAQSTRYTTQVSFYWHARTCWLVAMPRMSSTSAITTGGFIKCTPMTLSGRRVAAAKRVMERELVLLVSIACGGVACGRCDACCCKHPWHLVEGSKDAVLHLLALAGCLDDHVDMLKVLVCVIVVCLPGAHAPAERRWSAPWPGWRRGCRRWPCRS